MTAKRNIQTGNSLTQRRQGAKTRRITGSDCHRNRSLNGALVFMKSISSSNPCAFASLRLCVKTRLHRYGLERVEVFEPGIVLKQRYSARNAGFMSLNSLTQRRQGAKTRRITGSDCRPNLSSNSDLVFMKSISSFNPCAFASLRLCVKTRLQHNP